LRARAAALALTPTSAPADAFFAYSRSGTYGVHVERAEVPLRDGSHLACDIHRPDAPGRFPSIVLDFNAYDLLTELAPPARYFVQRGYAAAVTGTNIRRRSSRGRSTTSRCTCGRRTTGSRRATGWR
jgi:predicted acyl esterase